MAGSRLEKIGTIFSRSNGLLKAGAVHWEDRPLWFDLYKRFPPFEQPNYDRPSPQISLKSIFYEEDKIRSFLHNYEKRLGFYNLSTDTSTVLTMKFITLYEKFKSTNDSDLSNDELYKHVLDVMKAQAGSTSSGDDHASLASSYTDAKKRNSVCINVNDIFKER